MKLFVYISIISFIILASCKAKVQEAPFDFSAEKAKKDETLIKMNSYLAKRNQELIAQFVKRTGLLMKETGSGLWYRIYENGKGKPVKQGDIVKISYSLRLLDGTFVDSSTLVDPKVFIAGKGNIESGLEEGILLLHQGDRVWFILPPHIAYGNFGDQEKIPPGAFLFYDLYLSEVNPRQ